MRTARADGNNQLGNGESERLSGASFWQIGPSITPLTNLNSGFRVYEVDSGVRPLSWQWWGGKHRDY